MLVEQAAEPPSKMLPCSPRVLASVLIALATPIPPPSGSPGSFMCHRLAPGWALQACCTKGHGCRDKRSVFSAARAACARRIGGERFGQHTVRGSHDERIMRATGSCIASISTTVRRQGPPSSTAREEPGSKTQRAG